MVRAALVMILATSSAACLRTAPSPSDPPPPRGQSLDQYLAQDAGPVVSEDQAKDADSIRLHVIDIGQGLAALVEFPCGVMLMDTGGEYNEQFDSVVALTNYLDEFFARRSDLDKTIDLLVISHPHIDHTRGIAAVLDRYRVSNIVDNGDVREDIGGKPQLFMHDWLARNPKVGHLDLARSDIDPAEGLSSPVIDPISACRRSTTDPLVRALWSGDIGREELGHNPNNDSVVLRIDYGESSFLLPGDLELLALAKLIKKYRDHPEMLDADVYLFPHHGSRNSSTQEIIKQVSPEVAVISAGPYERTFEGWPEYTARAFGHPHRDAIDHLLHPSHGVSGRREPIEVWVGKRGRWEKTPSEFERRTIERAVYVTGWDGDVVVTGYPDGTLRVDTGKRPAASRQAHTR